MGKHGIALVAFLPWASIAILLHVVVPYAAFILGVSTFALCGACYLGAILLFSKEHNGRLVPLSNSLTLSFLYLTIGGLSVSTSVFAMWMYWNFTTP
ncbi:MAG: hypothetical protein Aurels2KO_39960 [Aureliella sp.]